MDSTKEHSKELGRKAEQSTFNGTRKLVRPHLPQVERRHDGIHTEDPLSHAMSDGHATLESSHAEAFYFQKQMQQQTEMTVILEDGKNSTALCSGSIAASSSSAPGASASWCISPR